MELRKQETKIAYRFLAVPLLLYTIFGVLPVLYSLYLSFTRYSVIQPTKWIGLANFVNLFNDSVFIKSIWNTIYYAFGLVVPGTIVSLVLAVLINRKIRGRSIFRTIFYLPVVTSLVAVAFVWQYIFNPTQAGLLNYILKLLFKMPAHAWLQDVRLAMPSIIVTGIWKRAGYNMVLFLAGLQSIPEQYYEASTIDGANKWHQFRYITVPLLKPVILLVLIIGTINAFQVFTQVFIMTQGGPVNSTITMVYWIYTTGFKSLRMGEASAMSIVLTLIIVFWSIIQYVFVPNED
jgi:multiple sugar transport system permease protein